VGGSLLGLWGGGLASGSLSVLWGRGLAVWREVVRWTHGAEVWKMAAAWGPACSFSVSWCEVFHGLGVQGTEVSALPCALPQPSVSPESQ
jgi:hypothetical protein